MTTGDALNCPFLYLWAAINKNSNSDFEDIRPNNGPINDVHMKTQRKICHAWR